MPYYMINPAKKPKPLGNAEILRRIAQKPGHWEIIYPDPAEIVRTRTRITVKCLDCGTVREIWLNSWISKDNLHRGCPHCANVKRRKVNKDAKLS